MALRYTKATAIFSIDGTKRYQLYREWDAKKKTILFVLFNPSTASATQDDPTLRRVVGFAASWGFGSVLVGNLYPHCSPSPEKVPRLGVYDPKNNAQVAAMCTRVATVVYAWGQNHPVPKWLWHNSISKGDCLHKSWAKASCIYRQQHNSKTINGSLKEAQIFPC